MKKFKLFFYPIFLITAVLVLYFSLDIIINMDDYLDKIDFATLRKLPNYALGGFLFIAVLMLAEFTLENLQMIQLRKKVKEAEKEVINLKAKLYDQNERATPTLDLPESFDIPEEDDEDDDDQ
jgi:hypothetical protein